MNIDFQSVKLFLRDIFQQFQIFHNGQSQAIFKPIVKVFPHTPKISNIFEMIKTIIIGKSAVKTFSPIGKSYSLRFDFGKARATPQQNIVNIKRI